MKRVKGKNIPTVLSGTTQGFPNRKRGGILGCNKQEGEKTSPEPRTSRTEKREGVPEKKGGA